MPALRTAAACWTSPAGTCASRLRRFAPGSRSPGSSDAAGPAPAGRAARRGPAPLEGDAAARDRQLAALDHLILLPGVMRVAGVGEIGDRRADMGHGREADAHMRVRMHRDADAEGPADLGQMLRRPQTAPVMMVRQDDLDGVQPDGLRNMPERHRHHVGRERHRREARHLAHFLERAAGILEIFEQARLRELRHHAPRRLHAPAAVGIDPEWRVRKGAAECPERLDLEIGLEDAALQLDRAEAIGFAHTPRLLDHLVMRQRLAPSVGGIAGIILVAAELVEEVGRIGHAIAHRAAEDLMQRQARDLALQVEERHFEGAKRAGPRLVAFRRERFLRPALAGKAA